MKLEHIIRCEWEDPDLDVHSAAIFSVDHEGVCGFTFDAVCAKCFLAHLQPGTVDAWRTAEGTQHTVEGLVTWFDYEAMEAKDITVAEAIEIAKGQTL